MIATDIRGCRQVVDDGVTGLLIPSHDAGAAAGAVSSLALDPHRRAALAAGALERARVLFDQERVIDITLRAYEDLLASIGADAPTVNSLPRTTSEGTP